MTAYQLLQLLSQVLFVLIAGVVTIKALNRPLKANIDTALLFDVTALLVAVSWLDEKVGITPGRLQTGVLDSLIMALPYLLIRMVDDFAGMSPTLLRTAGGGFVVSAISLCVLPQPYPGIFLLFYVLYFVGFTVYAAAAFVQAAHHAGGVTRRRMEAAAAGAVCLAMVILVAGIAVATPKLADLWNIVSNMLALSCGLFFFLGFAPPRWLRRTWQEPEIRAFLGPAAVLPRLSDTRAIVRELERGAARSLGVANAIIGLWDSEAGVMRYNIGRIPREMQSDQFLGGRSFITQRPIFSAGAERDDPDNAEHYRAVGANAVIAAPITAGEKRLGVLCVYAAHAPLFAEDDLGLVTLLANQAAVILESRALIDEASRVRAREEAARLKDDFLSAAAHDLKTPLTALVAQAQLMERRARRNPEAPADLASIGCIVQESQRLKRLVLELLDVARVEQGKLVGRKEAVDLVQLAREACARHSTDLHRYVLEAPEQLMGEYDGIRILQMIDNVLENAGKYSPAGGEVQVRIQEDGDSARITITDPGIGIPAADLARLFDRFHRGGNVDDRTFAGMGLGLFICRGIVEQHGGIIWATSPGPGQGSTFHIVLPIQVTTSVIAQPISRDREVEMDISDFAVEQAS